MTDRDLNQPSFRGKDFPAQVEQHLSYEEVVDYLVTLDGQEQVVQVALHVPTNSVAGGRKRIASRSLLMLVGTVGRLRRGSSRESLEPDSQDSASVIVPIGRGLLELPAASFTDAIRLSLGPEVNALLVELDDIQILVQDVLTELNPGS